MAIYLLCLDILLLFSHSLRIIILVGVGNEMATKQLISII